jgi:hypothetical protein
MANPRAAEPVDAPYCDCNDHKAADEVSKGGKAGLAQSIAVLRSVRSREAGDGDGGGGGGGGGDQDGLGPLLDLWNAVLDTNESLNDPAFVTVLDDTGSCKNAACPLLVFHTIQQLELPFDLRTYRQVHGVILT